MTAMTVANDDEAFDWRTQGACSASDADLHYADADELIEEQGYSRPAAKAFVREAEEMAKAICVGCPIRSKCLAAAMANEEQYGVWGGKTVAERAAYRPAYMKMKRALGIDVSRTVQKDVGALHRNPGVDQRYRAREANARVVLAKLAVLPKSWTLDTRKWLPANAHYGVHSRDTLIELFDLIRLHPTAKADDLARGLGRSTSWFNSLTRSCRRELAIGH